MAQLVVADTSPINYLIQIGHLDILPALFEKVILPPIVRYELAAAPPLVRNWIASPPSWVEIREDLVVHADPALRNLDPGEESAIALALELHAELILMDDRAGVAAARTRGLTATGTLGVLGLAAQHDLLDLADAFDRIKRTNFRYRQDIMDALLAEASRIP